MICVGIQLPLWGLELEMEKSNEEFGIEIESWVVETNASLGDLSSESGHGSLLLGGHSSKKRCTVFSGSSLSCFSYLRLLPST